jgi:hypothetical protein
MAKQEKGKLKFKATEVDSTTLMMLTCKGYQMKFDGDEQTAYFEKPQVYV